jgi:hypothetical protein
VSKIELGNPPGPRAEFFGTKKIIFSGRPRCPPDSHGVSGKSDERFRSRVSAKKFFPPRNVSVREKTNTESILPTPPHLAYTESLMVTTSGRLCSVIPDALETDEIG